MRGDKSPPEKTTTVYYWILWVQQCLINTAHVLMRTDTLLNKVYLMCIAVFCYFIFFTDYDSLYRVL